MTRALWPALVAATLLSAPWLSSEMFLDDWHVLYTASEAPWTADGLSRGFTFLDRSSIATWNLPPLPAYHYFRPLVVASYKLDLALWGLSPLPSHLVNLLLHLICVVLVGLLARRLGASGRATRWAALLFAIQPQVAVAVIWTSGRTEVLAGALILAAVWVYVVGRQQGRPGLIAGAAALQALACLAKENALVVPALLAAYELSRLVAGEGLELRRRAAALAPSVVILAGFLVYRFLIFDSGGALGPPYFHSPLSSGFALHALAKTAYNLAALPTTAMIVPLFAVDFLCAHPLALAALVAAVVALYWALLRRGRWRRPLVSSGLLMMAAALAPTVPILTTDLYLYLPSVGLALVLAGAAEAWLEGADERWRRRWRGLGAAYLALFALGFTGRGLLYHVEGEVNARIYRELRDEIGDELRPGTRLLLINMPLAASHIAPMVRLNSDVDEVEALLVSLSPAWTMPTERPRVECLGPRRVRVRPPPGREAFFETREERALHLLEVPLEPDRRYRAGGVTVTPVSRGGRVMSLDLELDRPLALGLDRLYLFVETDDGLAHRVCAGR